MWFSGPGRAVHLRSPGFFPIVTVADDRGDLAVILAAHVTKYSHIDVSDRYLAAQIHQNFNGSFADNARAAD